MYVLITLPDYPLFGTGVLLVGYYLGGGSWKLGSVEESTPTCDIPATTKMIELALAPSI